MGMPKIAPAISLKPVDAANPAHAIALSPVDRDLHQRIACIGFSDTKQIPEFGGLLGRRERLRRSICSVRRLGAARLLLLRNLR